MNTMCNFKPWTLIGHYSISDDKNESNANGGPKGELHLGPYRGGHHPLPENWNKGEGSWRAGGHGRVASIPNHEGAVMHDGGGMGRDGPHEAHYRWEDPHKQLLKGGLKSPGGTNWGWSLSARSKSTREALSSSSASDLLCNWCGRLS